LRKRGLGYEEELEFPAMSGIFCGEITPKIKPYLTPLEKGRDSLTIY
jgi:hypothetical protein